MSPLPPLSGVSFSSLSHPLALRSLLPSTQQLAPHPKNQLLPSRTLPPHESLPRSLASLFRRQEVVTTVTATASPTRNTVTATPLIPANYAGIDAGPPPGTVVGIVFGSVAGFLLILWIIYTCFGFLGGTSRSSVIEEEVIRRRSRSPSRRRSSPPRRSPSRRHSSTHSASEVIEIRSTRERTPPPPRRESRVREQVIIEETRRTVPQEDDVVEVIEEHSPPPKRERRKSSGYRTVDPQSFGGGSGPFRKVSRR